MPILFKLFLIVFAILCWAIPTSASISFVYENEHLIEAIISYLVLFSIYITFVIFQHRFEKGQARTFFQRLPLAKKVGFVLSSLCFPVLVGSGLALLTPITADLFASEVSIHEFKPVRVEPYAKSFRQLSKLHVVDTKNNEFSFVIKNEMLEQLHLQTNQTFVARGRKCLAGFVIDNINGVDRK